jgi:hypothetical protein
MSEELPIRKTSRICAGSSKSPGITLYACPDQTYYWKACKLCKRPCCNNCGKKYNQQAAFGFIGKCVGFHCGECYMNLV